MTSEGVAPEVSDDRPLSVRVPATAEAVLPGIGSDLIWRRADRGDLVALFELDRACGAIDHPRIVHALDVFEEAFARSGFDPAQDTALAVDATGRVVAYGEAYREPEAATAVKVRLNGQVHPDRRGEGIGTALLAWQEARGRQLLAGSPHTLPGWLNAGVESAAAGQLRLLQRAGFAPARWWSTMSRDLAEPIPVVAMEAPLHIAPYEPEWSEDARMVVNDAFRDHWGTQPITPEEWRSFERLDAFSAELSSVVLATDADGAKQVVAALWTMVNQEEWEANGFSFGYIEMLGVARTWRGRRIAQALLAHTLTQLRARGLERAVLDVDSDSPTGAFGLYERVGFREFDTSVTVVKVF
ncbi:GNAT family N-acetyltransferase [Microbacterium nymphoidis]|uniref:GNAT family N-acetyltransferase n=1 Tax=Microbacterium nymphoidis TaxID=2898586 RepID=UPI001E573846|nr:GNAT family N-acetyltransferase [Microbacterium nymphoidis]MCD2498435.1 GNAT family N-acetyltransferase [Microbacterium nymphoidis]